MKKLLTAVILLFSLNSFSMYRIVIDNPVTGRSGSPEKELQEAEKWVSKNLNNGSWGEHRRWVKFDGQTNCIAQRDILPEIGPMFTECQLEYEYTICGKIPDQVNIALDCQDITAEIQAKKDKEALDNARIDELKLKDKAMTKDELIELLQLKGVL